MASSGFELYIYNQLRKGGFSSNINNIYYDSTTTLEQYLNALEQYVYDLDVNDIHYDSTTTLGEYLNALDVNDIHYDSTTTLVEYLNTLDVNDIYYDSTTTLKEYLDSLVTSPSIISSSIITVNDIQLDSINFGSDYGNFAGQIKSIDFDESIDGSIWFNFETSQNCSLNAIYSNNSGSSGRVLLNYEIYIHTQSQVATSPNSVGNISIIANSNNLGVRYKHTDFLSITDITTPSTVSIKLTRQASNILDTMNGTFQLINLSLS